MMVAVKLPSVLVLPVIIRFAPAATSWMVPLVDFVIAVEFE